MNDLSATDIMLFGALAGALALIVLAGLWALAHRGRRRFNAERVEIITASAGDAVVVTYPGQLTQDQRTQIIKSIERRLPDGVIAMVLDGGLRMSHVVSVSDAPIEQPNEARNG
jgi:hypothetical protein